MAGSCEGKEGSVAGRIEMWSYFKIVEKETTLCPVENEGADKGCFRVLGGMTLRLAAVGDAANNYEWSATSGKFFNSYSCYGKNAQEVTAPKGPQFKEIYWQADTNSNVNATITLKAQPTSKATNGGKAVEISKKIKTRELKKDIESGDDIKMLSSFLQIIGLSEGDTPGVMGTPVIVRKSFDAPVEKALKRFQKNDEITINGIVDVKTLEKIKIHWTDYLAVFDEFKDDDNNKKIGVDHAKFDEWLDAGAAELEKTFDKTIQQSMTPQITAKMLLKAWIGQEAGSFGHWGHRGKNYRITKQYNDYRVTLGSGDELGSIGFSQILNKYKYGKNPNAAIKDINLYHPKDAIKAFAVFSNDKKIGGGFYYAFKETGKNTYKAEPLKEINYPHIGRTYYDDNKDLLSKGIAAYNGGANRAALRRKTWPELLKMYEPKNAEKNISKNMKERERDPISTAKVIKYAIEIQKRIEENEKITLLRSWTWTDIENGKEFSFAYGEKDWLPKKKDVSGKVIIPGTSWKEKRDEAAKTALLKWQQELLPDQIDRLD